MINLNKRAELAFEMAKQVAQQSKYFKFHIGCVITYKGMVIATGVNSDKTHPMQKEYNKYRIDSPDDYDAKCHAEIAALLHIKDKTLDPRKMCLYVYRIRKTKEFGMARPCPSCMQAIKDFGIRTIFYTTDDGYAEEHLF